MTSVRFGTAGWSYADWKGVVYPKNATAEFDALRYLAAYVDVLEINSSFYRPPDPRHATRWASAVDGLDDFRFTAKLYQGFTHRDEWSEDDVRAFKDGVRPLVDAGRLSAVLAQFPFFFDAKREHLERLGRIIDTFDDVPLVVELRHRSLLAPRILERLSARGVSFCNVDQPRSSTSIDVGARVTGPIGYLRLHGRNSDAWFSKAAGRDEKYDYLYSPDELDTFVPLIRDLVERTDDTVVIGNNHFLGKAPANALELKAAFEGVAVEVPPALVRTYPRLRAIAVEETEETEESGGPESS